MAEEKPRQGKALSGADAKSKDKSKMGVATTERPKSEVEGQAIVYTTAVCPNGHLVWLYYDTVNYHYYTCGVCGVLFYV
jgi:hypothetical protein